MNVSFRLIACDYDGTIATDGAISPAVEPAMARARQAGLSIGLVTGREFGDLRKVCPHLDMFDVVVAENGAVIYYPGTGVLADLAPPPAPEFLVELRRNGIRFSAGRAIVGISRAHEGVARSMISKLGLQLDILLNRDSAMVLPAGVDKATGLEHAASSLGIRMSEVVAIGDAENDLAFMEASGLSVAVSNAIDLVRAAADVVADAPNGEGVARFICQLLLRSNPDYACEDRPEAQDTVVTC